MLLRVGGLWAAVFVAPLLIQMQMATNGYAARRAGIVCVSSLNFVTIRGEIKTSTANRR
jgi:hypothetical protein